MMKVISRIKDQEAFKQDKPALLKMHAKALKNESNWDLFGGSLTVNGRTYQVVESLDVPEDAE